MNLEKVEISHSRMLQEFTEASDVDLIIAVKIEVTLELIIECISDEDTIVVKDVSQVCGRNLGLS